MSKIEGRNDTIGEPKYTERLDQETRAAHEAQMSLYASVFETSRSLVVDEAWALIPGVSAEYRHGISATLDRGPACLAAQNAARTTEAMSLVIPPTVFIDEAETFGIPRPRKDTSQALALIGKIARQTRAIPFDSAGRLNVGSAR